MITGDGIPRSGHDNRGRKKDLEIKSKLIKRETKRKTIEDAEEFAAILSGICPAYFEIND